MEVVNVAIATNILQCLIPISQFNKGQASKIFDRLHDEKELIVLKNNQPDNGNKETVSMDYVMRNLGIDEKEFENAEDIDIE